MTSIILHHWAIYVYLGWILTVSTVILCQRRASDKVGAASAVRPARPVRTAIPTLRPIALNRGNRPTETAASAAGKARLPKMPPLAWRKSLTWEPFVYSI